MIVFSKFIAADWGEAFAAVVVVAIIMYYSLISKQQNKRGFSVSSSFLCKIR